MCVAGTRELLEAIFPAVNVSDVVALRQRWAVCWCSVVGAGETEWVVLWLQEMQEEQAMKEQMHQSLQEQLAQLSAAGMVPLGLSRLGNSCAARAEVGLW